MAEKEIKKILLAYSGGLDTSVAIKWLQDKYDAEIITYTAHLGQPQDWDAVEEKALATGASKAYIDDIREEFITEYVYPALKVNAMYQEKYPLATALARPLISKRMVEIAKKEGVDALAHGCTGKGNDQVRFEVSFKALAPEMEIIAPLRDWEFVSRDAEIEYAEANNIPVKATKDSPYSIDQNLWGISIECGILEDPWAEPPADAYQWTKDVDDTPDQPKYLTIDFEKGIPTAIDGKEMDPITMVEKLNEIGSEYGVGRIDMLEDRLVGIKSREIYEAPAGEILITAHKALEDLTLDRDTKNYKAAMSAKYAELTYNGLWFSPLRDALDAFVDKSQQTVTGTVKVKLYKAKCTLAGRKSEYSLYDHGLATYDESDNFDHKAAPGFINLWALPVQVANQKKREE
ncbi:MAG: argininosuccinate synthase [Halanaerobium sp. 4-GBenrich]|jgi:argininosuccinate synthase|uniref:Argininosuccinate synthase n=1 Tax=Halanaerobium congolense TaxID=54121 RepID=A0A1G6M4F0_9FIRM|nr:argininosuccinate synthase [Halanaerobium congolense]KXS48078.1 MAG: argininosuccinate synthase [Halanaerobium sp. T82-1]ODS50327.1 MAG: argininosuccinate synthase [Halanaerobium sp. 4-GBenrich]OEG62135.1 MAG: argininosuccinate synthase [Halanaerobium sp. MDAL1]PUU90099.1 MAG: argininosuccinate synthase [Halanaerobium sp.]PTX16609.1 argininosuccinate synthase [Halanaerobium congolense]